MAPISGHVFRFEGQRRPVWRAKYRLPDGRQVKRTIGPAWTERGRPRAGYYTKRSAETWLRDVLDQARAGTLPGMVRTGVTFADACAEYLRYVEVDLDRKPSTLTDYRSIIRAHLLPAFGPLRLEDITADRIEAWKATLPVGNRTKCKILTVLNGVLKRARRVHKLHSNPMADVEKPRHLNSTAIGVFSPEEVRALVRAGSRACRSRARQSSPPLKPPRPPFGQSMFHASRNAGRPKPSTQHRPPESLATTPSQNDLSAHLNACQATPRKTWSRCPSSRFSASTPQPGTHLHELATTPAAPPSISTVEVRM